MNLEAYKGSGRIKVDLKNIYCVFVFIKLMLHPTSHPPRLLNLRHQCPLSELWVFRGQTKDYFDYAVVFCVFVDGGWGFEVKQSPILNTLCFFFFFFFWGGGSGFVCVCVCVCVCVSSIGLSNKERVCTGRPVFPVCLNRMQ